MCNMYAFNFSDSTLQKAEVSWEISENSDSSTLDGSGEEDVQRALSNII